MRVAFTIMLNAKHHLEHNNYADYIATHFDHWIIAEGAVLGKGGTSWYKQIPEYFHNNGNSNDGTVEYINELSKKYTNVHVIDHKGFWKNKEEQVNSTIYKLRSLSTPCYLWEIDADEQWDINDIIKAEKRLDNKNGKTGLVQCIQFVGENLIAKGEWGDKALIKRLWKWDGELFQTHAPPTLVGGNGKEVVLDLKFNHYSYYFEKDVIFKDKFYTGHDDIYNKWKSLQEETNFPQPINRLISGYWGTTNTKIIKLKYPSITIDFIIPYRDRPDNLKGLLFNIKKFYHNYCNYNIIICEQNDNKPFLRGQLFNLGFKKSESDIIVLMDIDIRFLETIDIIEHMRKINKPFLPWNRIQQIKSEENGKFKFSDKCESRICGWGGCFVCKRKHFKIFGGFSNLIFGWGAEDNIVYERCKNVGYLLINDEKAYRSNKLDYKLGHISHVKNNSNPLYWHNHMILKNHRIKKDDTYKQTTSKFSLKINGNIKHYTFSEIGVTDDFKYSNLIR